MAVFKQNYPLGTQYIMPGKAKNLCTIVDFRTTTNLSGEIMQTEYVATFQFMGKVLGHRPAASMIARHMVKNIATKQQQGNK